VFFATGLIAVLAEAAHSFTDVLQTGFLLAAARLSAAPPDEAHPFGHARGENLAAIVAALLIVAFVAAELVRGAVGALLQPGPPPQRPGVALLVLGASAVVLLWPLVLARRDMRAHGGVVRAQAVESLNDVLGVVTAFAGVVLVLLGLREADALAALLVAAIIIFNALQLFRANLPFLVGGSPPQEFYERVAREATGVPGVLGVHSLAAEYIGPTQVHLDMSLTVPDGMSIAEADELAHRVRHRLRETLGLQSLAVHFCSASGDLRLHGRQAPAGSPGGPAKLRGKSRRPR
jgi:cation diffusion facilitator family transporter